jgi:hypothetical protein
MRGRSSMPGVHILPDQHDLFHALPRQVARFGDDRIDAARLLGSPRVGHHAECAELVAAFLHGKKR